MNRPAPAASPDRRQPRERRLLLLPTSNTIGGMERIVLSLAGQFAARHWSVQTVFAQTPDAAALLAWSRDQGIDAEADSAVRDITASHTFADMRALRRLVRARRPHVVNLHYGGSHISIKDVLAVRLAGRHRCVVSLHLPVPWRDAGEQKRRMTRLAAHLCDGLVANSTATRAVLLDAGIPAGKIQIVPCGVRPPTSLPPRADARARMGLPPGTFVIVTHARLVPHKGIADLVEAVTLLPDPLGTLRLMVAGDGPERAALTALAAARLGTRAIFTGHLAETADLYAAADVFALPTRLEGFGLVFVEAAFHGVPSIGTATGGVPDAVRDGETGLLVPPGDIAALAAAIQRLRDDPAMRARLGAAARVRAHAEFTEEAMADRYRYVLSGAPP
jgi:glycosyltransferase involved in cell wall biosynthesis